MATFKQQVLVLEFIWISYWADASPCRVTVTQPPFMEVSPASSSVTIPCSFSADGCNNLHILWFRFLAHTHEDICTPTCANSAKFKVKDAMLQINQLSVEDSAIYFCGVASSNSNTSTSKQTGSGTVLVIRDTYSRGVHIMAAILSLLFLYLIAILTIFKFFSKPKFKKTEKKDPNGKHSFGSKESREEVCRAIAKELYKKRKSKRWPGCLNNSHKTDEPS